MAREFFPLCSRRFEVAQDRLNFESFSLSFRASRPQFRDALAERARAGVRVRVLLDGIGSSSALDDSYVKTLKESACSFAYYHPVTSGELIA